MNDADALELRHRLEEGLSKIPDSLPTCGYCNRKNPRWTIDRVEGHSWSDGMRLKVCGHCRNLLIRRGYFEDRKDPEYTGRLRALGPPGEKAKERRETKKDKTTRLRYEANAYRRMMQETRPQASELMALGLLFHLHPDWI